MTDVAGGSAVAGDAQAVTENDVGQDPEDAEASAREAVLDEARAAVTAAETKIERLGEHLAAAEQALSDARAALETCEQEG